MPASAADAMPARVAAASDLQFALPALAAQFERATGRRMALGFGSSGNLARQIQQGAPIDLFLSADESFALRLADAGLTRDRGTVYAIGRIALIVPAASPIALDGQLAGLAARWSTVQRFALANPEHAPYGRAAREALRALGWWDRVEAKLVLGESMAQATQYVATGTAQAGITALSLAVAPAVAAATRHVPLADGLHQPLRQRMVLMRNAPPAAVAFYDFLASRAARELLAHQGFAAPPATP
jgi:molybdate transport system substrate-binding protein